MSWLSEKGEVMCFSYLKMKECVCSRMGTKEACRGNPPSQTERKAHESFRLKESQILCFDFYRGVIDFRILPKSRKHGIETLKRETMSFRLRLANLVRRSSSPNHYLKNILMRPPLEYQTFEKEKVFHVLPRAQVQGNVSKNHYRGILFWRGLDPLDPKCQGML